MELNIEAVTNAPRTYKGQTYWGVKSGGDHWYDFYVSEKPTVGKTYRVIVTDRTGSNGRIYQLAKLAPLATQPQAQSATNGNGAVKPAEEQPKEPAPQAPKDNRIPLAEWCAAAKAFHVLAKELEPDETNEQGMFIHERSQARAAMVNTAMIAFSNGKISLELPEEDSMPF